MSENTFPAPGENPLLDAQLHEAAEISAFIQSPVWTWLKAHLERQRLALLAKATGVGGERPLSTDERMLVLGKFSLVEEIMARPARLMDLLKRKGEADMLVPGTSELTSLPAPQRVSMGLL